MPQSLNVTLLCTPEETDEPTFTAYDGTQVQVEWKAAAGCPLQGNDPPKDDPNDGGKIPDDGNGHESTGSGLGWFFLMYAQPTSRFFYVLTRWYSLH